MTTENEIAFNFPFFFFCLDNLIQHTESCIRNKLRRKKGNLLKAHPVAISPEFSKQPFLLENFLILIQFCQLIVPNVEEKGILMLGVVFLCNQFSPIEIIVSNFNFDYFL